MLYLPKNTPNYMLHIETGLHTLFLETLNLHFSYIRRVFKLGFDRLPRILAEETVSQNTFWFSRWRDLCGEIGYTLDIENWRNNFQHHHNCIIESLRNKEHEQLLENARNSRFHDMYPILQYDAHPYFLDINSAHLVSVIMKARGGLLNLNNRAFYGNNNNNLCTLCNRNEPENTLHLIGKCPIFASYRFNFFDKRYLTLEEVIAILNGQDYVRLYKYLLICLKYRDLIISEYS